MLEKYSKNQKLVIKTGIVMLCIIAFSIYSLFSSNNNKVETEYDYNKRVQELYNNEGDQNDEQLIQKEPEIQTETPDNIVFQQIKEKATRDFPNDYTTQEYWINEQKQAYLYMKSIPDDEIKQKAELDFPIDYTTQKYWYNEQIEAKKRMNQ